MSTPKLRGNRFFLLAVGAFLPALIAQTSSKKPIDYVNTLVGTTLFVQQKLIGNSPPAGERLYYGVTSPVAALPHSSTGPKV